MNNVIIVGGGWAGCAAALTAAKRGVSVTLIERTDMLLGLGNAGGIMRNNGRFTAAEENIAMGAGELFDITDRCSLHRNVDFPGHRHASFYNVTKVEPEVRQLLKARGINVRMMTRIVDVEMGDGRAAHSDRADGERQTEAAHSEHEEGRIIALLSSDGERFEGDVFIDCTGTTGSMGNCMEYGNGCSMCVLRCPAFGPRVSISNKSGGRDYYGIREDGTPGAFSGSCKLEKLSLSQKIISQLNNSGVAVVPLPEHLKNPDKLKQKVCRQYALPSFAENIILIDTGFAKMMTPYFPLEELRQVEGFEHARYIDPLAGGKGNSIRYLAITERDSELKVSGVANLFCAGEKAGPFVGHTEAITTGSLAGYNAGRMAAAAAGASNLENAAAAHPSESTASAAVTLSSGNAACGALPTPPKDTACGALPTLPKEAAAVTLSSGNPACGALPTPPKAAAVTSNLENAAAAHPSERTAVAGASSSENTACRALPAPTKNTASGALLTPPKNTAGGALLTLLTLPKETACGALLAYKAPERGMLTFAGDEFFEYMKHEGLYTTDREEIRRRIEAAGLLDIYC